jgi:hypothetical protein
LSVYRKGASVGGLYASRPQRVGDALRPVLFGGRDPSGGGLPGSLSRSPWCSYRSPLRQNMSGPNPLRAHIGNMPEYVGEAFVVLVHIYGPDGTAQREEYLVGCPTREMAEVRIRAFFQSGADINVFASPLGASEVAGLNLLPNEIRPRQ